MKLLINSYTFAPGPSNAGTVTFTGYASINLSGVLLIVNVTKNATIYNFADTARGGTVATNVLTLTLDTSSMAAADKLMVFYDDAANTIGSLTETAPATDTASSGLNGRLQRIAQNLTTLTTGHLASLDSQLLNTIIPQEGTTGGANGITAFGAVTTSKPTYTNLKSDALSLDVNGLLRVSLADTPSNTNKLLVTPDALPANQSVNVAQVNGVTTLTGTGAVGTGAQRITVGTDTATIAGSAPGAAGTASAQVVTIQGIASMTKLLVTPDSVALPANQSVNVSQLNGTTTDTNSGTKSAGTLRVVIATDQPQLTNKLLVTPDSVALPANQSVNVAQVGGTTSVTAGVNGTLAVGGNVATNVAIGTNPINLGAQAVSSENTAVTTTRMAQLVSDLVGKLIVLPYANPENFVRGAITTAMTGTTSTSLIAAPATGLRNYITHIVCSNAHATVGTDIIIQDGSGGTTLYTIPAAAAYGGSSITLPVPIRQPTTATAIFCANVTTGASTKVSATGYKGV